MKSKLVVTQACVVRVPEMFPRSFEPGDIVDFGSRFYYALLWAGLATENGEPTPTPATEIPIQPVKVDINNIGDQYHVEWNDELLRWEVIDFRVTVAGMIQAALNGLVNNAPAAFDTLAEIAGTLQAHNTNFADMLSALNLKAPKDSPTFTGTVSGITKAMVGLGNVDNTSDVNKPVSTAQQAAINAAINNLIDSAPGTLDTLNEIAVALQNEQSATASITATLNTKAPINNPTFTGTVGGITKAMVGLANVDNVSDINKPISTATQTALNAKAPINNPTFTGTVNGVTKTMVGLGNVDNTSDANKPISTATQTALNAKQATVSIATKLFADRPEAYPAGPSLFETSEATWPEQYGTVFTNYININRAHQWYFSKVSGKVWVRTADAAQASGWTPWKQFVFSDELTKANVGLANVDNTSDASKPLSTAQKTYIDTAINNLINAAPGTLDTLGEIAAALAEDQGALDALTASVNTKAPINNPTFTGTVGGITKAMVGLGNVDNTSDVNKPISTAVQTALNDKQATIPAGTTAQYWRGDKTWQALNKAAVGLGNVDNTSDANKPISTATQTALNGKAASNHRHTTADIGSVMTPDGTKFLRDDGVWAGIGDGVFAPTGGTANDYLRGDTTWQTLNKAAVGLGNVDNTSDAAKPISTATQTALNGKANTSHTHIFSQLTDVIANGQLPTRLREQALTITDWNAAIDNGWFMGSSATNSPATGWYIGIVMSHNTTPGWTIQIVFPFTAGGIYSGADTGTYMRVRQNGTWGAWYRLSLSQAEQDARYAPKASPILSGAIQLGTANTDTVKTKAVPLETHTRTTEIVRSGGVITQVLEKDGATTVKTTTLNRNSEGVLTSVVETVGGTTATETIVRDAQGNLTGITRSVS